jgi:hypothetical protein
LRQQLRSLQEDLHEKFLATGGVRVSICEDGHCPVCAGPMRVLKTVCRPVQTLEHGPFHLREVVHVCAAGCLRPEGGVVCQRASSLAALIMPGRSVGYDLMAWIGLERFLHHRQREEIRTALNSEYGITLSAGEISVLTRLFLDYVRRLHQTCAPQLRRALESDGGSPWHLDATCEAGRGTLLVVLAGWRRWVLGAWKIPTECAEAIQTCAQETVKRFGAPCAIMRDLGPAMIRACEQLLTQLHSKIPVLSCHQHFLADIGSDLLQAGHDKLRNSFRHLKLRSGLRTLARDLSRELGSDLQTAREAFRAWQQSASHALPSGNAGLAVVRGLAQWALDYLADAEYQDFPYNQPYLCLYERCLRVRRVVDGLLRTIPEDRRVLRVLRRLGRLIDPVITEPGLANMVQDLRVRVRLFDELRSALRLFPKTNGRKQPGLAKPITPDQAAAQLRDLRAALTRFVSSLRQRRPERGPAGNLRQAIDIILEHLDKHGKSLWGHEICLPAKVGGGLRLVDRTNNLLESFFHTMKRGERRRSGRKNLAQDFEHLPPEAALVQNFTYPDYVAIVCGSLARLPHAFADMDATERCKSADQRKVDQSTLPNFVPMIETGSLPSLDRQLIRSEALELRIDDIIMSKPPRIPLSPPFLPSATV